MPGDCRASRGVKDFRTRVPPAQKIFTSSRGGNDLASKEKCDGITVSSIRSGAAWDGGGVRGGQSKSVQPMEQSTCVTTAPHQSWTFAYMP